jgi:hypothetical protein
MSVVDQLLVFLLEGDGSYFTKMLDAGYTAEEVSGPLTRPGGRATRRRRG